MKIWGTYESEAAKILRKKTPIMEKMDEEYTISYDMFDCNTCEYPNECENCARAIEDK